MSKINEILTKEYLMDCYNEKLSSNDISIITNINSRTIRYYMKKYSLPVLLTKSHKIWNKGLKAKDDDRIKKSTDAAKKARIGNSPWNKGLKLNCLSNETKKKISDSLKGKYIGENNSNWKGGITDKNKLARCSREFKKWREKVFERDSYKCQHCEQIGGELHPHHILKFSEYIELRFDISNGITLCKKCHQLEHKNKLNCKIKRSAISTW
jgi:hypothetical protein